MPEKNRGIIAYLVRGVIFIILFWALWWFASLFGVTSNSRTISAFYPVPALTISFIAIFGWRYIPVVLIASMSSAIPNIYPWDAEPFIWAQGLRQTIVYSSAGLFLPVLLGRGVSLANRNNALSFLAIGIIAALVSALIAVFNFWHFRYLPNPVLENIFFSFWAGDAAGVLMATPLFLVMIKLWKTTEWNERVSQYFRLNRRAIAVSCFVPLVIAGGLYSYIAQTPEVAIYGYLVIIPIAWIAVTYGVAIGAWAALVSNLSSVGFYSLFEGSIYTPTELQVFFSTASVISIILGALREDQETAEEKILKREAELAHLSRLASIGELGASISHEIATPLQVASINSKLALEHLQGIDTDKFEAISIYQTEVQKAITRATEIHDRIRRFAKHRTQISLKPTSIIDALNDACHLLNREITEAGAAINIHSTVTIPTATADAVSLQQVFVNLIKNALESIEPIANHHPKVSIAITQADRMININIADNGIGIGENDIERVFDSFYTTKSAGLGLGLAICRTTLEGFGGNITVAALTDGAQFTIQLPIPDLS